MFIVKHIEKHFENETEIKPHTNYTFAFSFTYLVLNGKIKFQVTNYVTIFAI